MEMLCSDGVCARACFCVCLLHRLKTLRVISLGSLGQFD